MDPRVDWSKIPDDLKAKLLDIDRNSPQSLQLRKLEDIAELTTLVINQLKDSQKTEKNTAQELGAVLVDMRESLSSLKDKEAPEPPDYAKPVVDGLGKLEKALTDALGAIKVNPVVNVPKADTPQVHIDAPKIDLRGVEAVLRTLPAAFDKAIQGIPKTEIPKEDYTPVTDLLKEMSEKLESIDKASRMKPSGNVKVINPSDFPGGGGGSGGLTDAELRATPVDVDTGLTQPTTPSDTQPVSATSLPLPTGAATSAKQLPDNHNVVVTSAPTTAVTAVSLPLPAGAATAAKQLANNHQVTVSNQIAQPLEDGGNVAVVSSVLPSGAATESTIASIDARLSGTIEVEDVPPVTVIGFVTTVTTAGTRVQFSSTAVEAGVLQADPDNPDGSYVYVGSTNVSSTVWGAKLAPGQATGLAIENSDHIWVDASANGCKIGFLGG